MTHPREHGSLPSNRKLMQRNVREVDLTQTESRRLARLINECNAAMNSFSYSKMDLVGLRTAFEPMYQMLKEYGELSFQREFDTMLMTEVTVSEINFMTGKTKISFIHTTAQQKTKYTITFRNHLYSDNELDHPWINVL